MDKFHPQGMNRPKDNGSEWYNKDEDARIGRHDYLKRQHTAMTSGRGDIEVGGARDSFIDRATLGLGNDSHYGQRFDKQSAGLQVLPTGRESQQILSPTARDNVGRMHNFADTSIMRPMRGSVTNKGSTKHVHNTGYAIKQDDPNVSVRVNENATAALADSADDTDGFEYLSHD
jgi:hypothetical protein